MKTCAIVSLCAAACALLLPTDVSAAALRGSAPNALARRLFLNDPASSKYKQQCIEDCKGNCFHETKCRKTCEAEHKCTQKPDTPPIWVAPWALPLRGGPARRLFLNDPAGSKFKQQCIGDCNGNCFGETKCKKKCEAEHKCAQKPDGEGPATLINFNHGKSISINIPGLANVLIPTPNVGRQLSEDTDAPVDSVLI